MSKVRTYQLSAYQWLQVSLQVQSAYLSGRLLYKLQDQDKEVTPYPLYTRKKDLQEHVSNICTGLYFAY